MGLFDASSLPSGPTSKGTTDSSIASWAQPYINNYLNKSQDLVNQGGQPNALQQQSYTGAANLQTPGQFGQGSSLLNQAGQGQLGTTGTALNYGQQAVGAGQNYQNMATSPEAMQAYMNPYIQQSLAPQLNLLNQQQALAGQGINAKAVGQGAFGGNRATLAQGLNAQNYDLARQQAIGQGYNTAFQNAQQAQQFGANLGLQGIATGLQGINQAQQGYTGAQQAGIGLGNLGYQQNQSDVSRLGLQNTLGTQQYQLPYQNLQFMQSMMSGLPVSNQQTQGWQAPPNALSQMTGLAGTAVTGAALANKLNLLPKFGDKTSSTAPSDLENPLKYDPSGAITDSQITVQPNNGGYITSAGNLIGGGGYDTVYATGGSVRRYASGGIVSLALDKAAKGKK
jgi:hypothetical protein